VALARNGLAVQTLYYGDSCSEQKDADANASSTLQILRHVVSFLRLLPQMLGLSIQNVDRSARFKDERATMEVRVGLFLFPVMAREQQCGREHQQPFKKDGFGLEGTAAF
jgi:hypothetical protein